MHVRHTLCAHAQILVSDASEPGEGEHKIMRLVRSLRARPDYHPNTRHAVFGQDADLLLLRYEGGEGQRGAHLRAGRLILTLPRWGRIGGCC